MFSAERVTVHRDHDDLLTAGLGLAGLRNVIPPVFVDPSAPTAAELRRRAIWSNWRGIADLSLDGGYGDLYGTTIAVPGREFSAYATVSGARHPHRVLMQMPDDFDHKRRCVVVTASSGSRGIYGAIALAGAWALPKGCAVAYTDKGAGTDYFDLDTRSGARADGTPGLAGCDDDLAFVLDAANRAKGIACKHAHSQDNPEADWGRHVQQAAEFALHALNHACPDDAPFTFDNTTIIAVGLSNGGGAVLRAAALDGDWLDAVVAAAPSIFSEAEGSRALYDYATEAALLMPCALLHRQEYLSPIHAGLISKCMQHCVSLHAKGVIDSDDLVAQAHDAYQRMRASGWSDASLRAGALSVEFDLWRAIAVTYASSYGRYAAGEHPCGYRFSAQHSDGISRAATLHERVAWWSDASGIPPGAGVEIIEDLAGIDSTIAGLRALRQLWDNDSSDALRVRKGVAQACAELPRAGLPMIVIHGIDDGLIPMAFTSTPYVTHARAGGCNSMRFWQVKNAQHFDAFLGLQAYGAQYLPLLPYVYAALDRVLAHLEEDAALPSDLIIETIPRGAHPLAAEHLALPRPILGGA